MPMTHARTRRRQLLVEPPGLAVVRLHRGDARPEAAGEGAPEVAFADRLVRLDHMRCDAHDGRLFHNARGHALLVHVDAFFRFLFLLLSLLRLPRKWSRSTCCSVLMMRKH